MHAKIKKLLHLTAGRKLEGDPIANPQCVKKKDVMHNRKISLHYLEMVPKKKKEKELGVQKTILMMQNHVNALKSYGYHACQHAHNYCHLVTLLIQNPRF
jgi:hypothetical protein